MKLPILPDKQRAIFVSLVELSGSLWRRRVGSGLGFAVSSRFDEPMGGRIEVTSLSKCGSNFRSFVTLPVVQCEHRKVCSAVVVSGG